MGPFQQFSPEVLAQMAQGAFRPPQPMGMQAPGMSMPQMGGGGDGGLGAGMAGLGMGLGMLGKMGGVTDGRTTPEGTVSPFPVGGGPMGPSGGAMAESPLLAAAAGGDGNGGFFDWIGRQFRGVF